MRILVTGANGFIGRHIVKALVVNDVAAPRDIYACDTADIWANDCRDLFRDDRDYFDLVFHCAATVGGREGIDYNAAYLGADNLSIDGEMWKWALRTKPGRIVYFSSAASYPTCWQLPGASPLTEDMVREGDSYVGIPDESYGWAKLTGEVIAQRVRAAGVPVSIVRPFSSYDVDQDDCYPFPMFIRRAVEHQDPFTVWGDGTQVRDWIHVDDLVSAILVMAREGIDGPVNLGTGVGTSMDDLARLCMKIAGYEAPIFHDLDKPVGVHTRVADNSLMRTFYEPQITIEEGVERAVKCAS